MRAIVVIIILISSLLLSVISFAEETNHNAPNLSEQSGGYYVNVPVDSGRTQNPTVALFKSMLVPGWGQLGNKKFVKAGIIIALEGALVTTLVHYSEKTSDARYKFDRAVDLNEKARLFNEFQSAKSERNRFSWYLGTTIFLSMFDAYVDAHLAKFPKYEKRISFDLAPQPKGFIGASVRLNF